MKNNEFFVGNLNKKNYFEGWYFKQVLSKKQVISIIPGISISNHKKHAFIQVIETINNKAYYIPYNIEDVKFSKDDFYIKIKNNYFSKNKIILDIDYEDLKLKGELNFDKQTPLSKTTYRPTIMGPFTYLKNMQCNHAIISMHHTVTGIIHLNNKKIKVKKGTGYIEKDYGTSFPRKYLWLHSNTSHTTPKISLTFSIADIPTGPLFFQGFFCVLLINKKEYYFTTYYNDSVKIKSLDDNNLHITLKNKKYRLELIVNHEKGQELVAPKLGKMIKSLKENLNTSINLTLIDIKKNKKVHEDYLLNSGFEYVKD